LGWFQRSLRIWTQSRLIIGVSYTTCRLTHVMVQLTHGCLMSMAWSSTRPLICLSTRLWITRTIRFPLRELQSLIGSLQFLCRTVPAIFLLCLHHNILFRTVHVSGMKNVYADRLSHGLLQEFHDLYQRANRNRGIQGARNSLEHVWSHMNTLIKESITANTRKAYSTSISALTTFTIDQGLPLPFPVTNTIYCRLQLAGSGGQNSMYLCVRDIFSLKNPHAPRPCSWVHCIKDSADIDNRVRTRDCL